MKISCGRNIRTVDVPVKWFPNLNKGNPQQLGNHEIWGDNQYIHWPDLDEDIAAETLISLSVNSLRTGYRQGRSSMDLDGLTCWLKILSWSSQALYSSRTSLASNDCRTKWQICI